MERTFTLQGRVVSGHVEIFHRGGPTNKQYKKWRNSELYGGNIQETKYRLKPESHSKNFQHIDDRLNSIIHIYRGNGWCTDVVFYLERKKSYLFC